MAFSFNDEYIQNLLRTGSLGDNVGQPQTSTDSSGDYAGTNADLEALLTRYQAGINVQDPNSIRMLAEAMQRDGIPAEVSADGLLIRVPGYDAGWVDPRQDKAFVEGRGDIRGWAFQPYYGSEDFDRLLAEGRNPHTGEFVGHEQARLYTRDSDFPMGDPRSGASGGGLPPGYSMTGVNNLASFNAPGINAPFTQQFKAPTGTDDPGFQFALNKGLEAIERSAASKGTLLTGGAMKDLADYATGMALQGYGQQWNRDFNLWNAERDTYWGNQQNAFGRLNSLANLGLGAATSYGNNASNISIGQGNVNAQAQVSGANARNAGIQNAVNTGLGWFDQFTRARQRNNTLESMAPADRTY